MVSGGRTFARDTSAETMTAILKEEPTQLSATASALPPELERTTLRCLEKNPGKRFQSAQDLSFTLRSLSSGPSRAMPAVEETEDEESRSSIAVLPFTNLSADPEQEYFCDGMTEEIISALCHIPNLRVIVRSSCFALKGKHRDVREVGKRLGAETLLEGSVRKIGTRLRITTQLVNVQDASHLWSRRFDREMEDVFAIQDEIAQSIVEALQFRLVSDEGGDGEQAIKLAEGEKADLVKRYTDDVEAYNSYLKGRYHWNRRTGDGLRRAIEYFEEAIDRDPEYALAHAGLADSFFVLPYYSSFPPRVAYPRAKRSALRALEIDGSLAECHTSLGLAKSMYDWDWEGAEAEFRTALELDPRYPIAHFWYGWFFLFQGQYEEAIASMKQALELEPLSSHILCDLGVAQYFAGQYDQALEQYRKTLEGDSTFSYPHLFLGWVYIQLAEPEKALAEFRKEREVSGGWDPSVVQAWIGVALARMGEHGRSQKILDEMEELSEHTYVSPYHLGLLSHALGNSERGLEWLEKAYSDKDYWLCWLRIEPFWDPYRSDPRIESLLKRMGHR
jgi:serine/threonine-protein kinase